MKWYRIVVISFSTLLMIHIIFVTQSCSRIEVTSIKGLVIDVDGNPVSQAVVRIKTTDKYVLTNSDGEFTFEKLNFLEPIKLTAWAPGYFIGGGEEVTPGTSDLTLFLQRFSKTDNPEYQWLSSTEQGGTGEDQGCAECHSNAGTELGITLPVDEWLLDAHSISARNPRFLSMYSGTNLDGEKSPQTRFEFIKDYGLLPIPLDPDSEYFGPGYKLDFPDSHGNCATCHAPLSAVNDPYGIDPTAISGVNAEGVSCDFCHKIWDVKLDPETGLPYPNTTGVLSYEFLRPDEGHQFFAGPLDDVAPGEDTYLPLQKESQFCAPCHQGVFWDTVIYDSYGEWLNSPYNDPETGQTCQDCHMPSTGATFFALPEKGGEERFPETISGHYMPGAMDEELLQNAVTMKTEVVEDQGKIIVTVELINDKTGHHVPTDSPLRHLILLVSAKDKDGPLTLMEGQRLPDWVGVGDPAEGFYAGLPGNTYAKVLREHWTNIMPSGAYWNPTAIEYDNRIAAFETTKSEYIFKSPSSGVVNLRIELWYRRAFIELTQIKEWNVPDILMESSELSISIDG